MRVLVAILLAFIAKNSTAAAEESSSLPPRTIVLVPAVRHGHSMTWKMGAIVTAASIGVSLIGAALVVSSLHGDLTEGGGRVDEGPWVSGLVLSVVGDGGAFIGGPITWMAGIGGDPSSR